jgi:microcystin-dependent protein
MTEADGAVIYNSTTNKIETVNNGNWVNIGMPAGSITAYAGAVAPSGWLVCDGSAVSRSTYGELFTAIGTTYGTGDGSTTFNLPDLRGRTAIGAGQGVGLTNRALGAKAGEETHALSTAEVPAHNYASAMSAPGMTDGGGFYALTAAGLSGVGAAHNNMQPFIALTYIIRH